MKKLLIVFACVFFLTGCNDSSEFISIDEKMFVTQINDIYLNSKNYQGKTIHLIGMYSGVEIDGKQYNLVYRNSPGCCGEDGIAGFEFKWDGHLPKEGEWIEVTGTINILSDKQGDINLVLSELKTGVPSESDFVSV